MKEDISDAMNYIAKAGTIEESEVFLLKKFNPNGSYSLF